MTVQGEGRRRCVLSHDDARLLADLMALNSGYTHEELAEHLDWSDEDIARYGDLHTKIALHASRTQGGRS